MKTKNNERTFVSIPQHVSEGCLKSNEFTWQGMHYEELKKTLVKYDINLQRLVYKQQ